MRAAPKRILCRSGATGTLRHSWAMVYPSQKSMVTAAHAFNGFVDDDPENPTLGICQVHTNGGPHGRVVTVPIIRLHRQRLGTQVLSHEVSHAATAIYGSTVDPESRARGHLDHVNEPLAHLHSDLLRDLVAGLYEDGLL